MSDNNLNQIRLFAKTLLNLKPKANKDLPFIIDHPFIANNPIGIKADDGIKLIDILEDKKGYHEYIKTMENFIDTRNSFTQIMFLLKQPYKLFFLNMCQDLIPKKEFSRCLADVWINTEFPNNDKNVSKSQILKMFCKSNPNILMSKSDQKILIDLPDIVEIYRGTHYEDDSKALSWTIDYETAKWFATRFNSDGYIITAKINKRDIFAFFDDRNEKEVVINYKKIKNLALEKVMKLEI